MWSVVVRFVGAYAAPLAGPLARVLLIFIGGLWWLLGTAGALVYMEYVGLRTFNVLAIAVAFIGLAAAIGLMYLL